MLELIGGVLALIAAVLVFFFRTQVGNGPTQNAHQITVATQAKDTKETNLEKTPASDLVDADSAASVLRDQSVDAGAESLRKRVRDRLRATTPAHPGMGTGPGARPTDGQGSR